MTVMIVCHNLIFKCNECYNDMPCFCIGCPSANPPEYCVVNDPDKDAIWKKMTEYERKDLITQLIAKGDKKNVRCKL